MGTISIPNGVAARIAPLVSPLSASGPPPPASSRATASAAIITPQVSLILVFGFKTPPADMLPSTMVPASAPATKKIKTRKSATSEVSRASGYWPRNSNSAMAAPSLATASPRLPLVWLSSRMPAEPNTENQIMEKRLGPISTPVMNSRMVRPLEMRAMKAPTYGPQAIHVAQKKMVQLPSRSASPGSKALILRLWGTRRSEEHTSELQSRQYLVCRLLLEKKK